jgi:hypothetical protein
MFLPVDALDSVEIDALAISIDDQCKRSPRFRQYVLQALKVQSATSLIAVVGMIGARRAARHGMIPAPMAAQVDAGVGVALAMMTGTAINESPAPIPFYTPPVEPEPEPIAQPVSINGEPLPPLAFTPPVA